MLVKNSYTGKKIERNDAFILKNGKRNLFFDNEKQAEKYFEQKNKKILGWELYQELFSNYIPFDRNKSLIVLAKRNSKLLTDVYDIDFIKRIFNSEDLKEVFNWAIFNKNFTSNKQKYFYLHAICRNKLDLKYDQYKLDKMRKTEYTKLSSEEQITKEATKQTNRSTKKKDISNFVD